MALEPSAMPDTQDVRDLALRVRWTVARVVHERPERIRDEDSLAHDLGADSFRIGMIRYALERDLPLVFRAGDIGPESTVGDVITATRSALAAAIKSRAARSS